MTPGHHLSALAGLGWRFILAGADHQHCVVKHIPDMLLPDFVS